MAIAFGTAGAAATGTTSLSVAYPTSIAAGDLLVLQIGNKYPTNGPSTPGGFTAPSNNQFSRGGGTPGADTGDVYSTFFYRVADGTETGSVTVTVTSANTSMGRMYRYTKAAGTEWSIACNGGSDNSAGTAWSVTAGGNPGVTANDMVLALSCLCGNTDTGTSQAMAQTGVTYGTMVERQDSGSNNGDDMSLWMTEHPVSSGTGSAAPVYTGTVGGTGSATAAGATVIVRLREIPTITLGFIASSTTLYGLTPESSIALGFIASSTTVHTLSADVETGLTINLDFIASTTTLYAPQAESTIALGFIASSTTVHNLSPESTIALGFIASTTALYNLTPESTIALGFIASATALYNPALESTIALGFIASGTALYSPALESTIALGFIASGTILYAPSVNVAGGAQNIALDFIASTTALYSPQLESSIVLGFIASGTTLYSPALESTIALGFIASTTALYTPTLTADSGAQTINLGFIASTTALYTLTLTGGEVVISATVHLAALTTPYDVSVTESASYIVEVVEVLPYTVTIEDTV